MGPHRSKRGIGSKIVHTLGEGGLEQNGDFTQGRLDIYKLRSPPGVHNKYETIVWVKNGYEAHSGK